MRSARDSLALPFSPPLSNFQRVSRAIGAAIGGDVCVMAKDADSDRMRHARAASRSARSRRDLVQIDMRGFLAMSACPRRARYDRRGVRGVSGATLCVVYGVEHHIQLPETLFVDARLV